MPEKDSGRVMKKSGLLGSSRFSQRPTDRIAAEGNGLLKSGLPGSTGVISGA